MEGTTERIPTFQHRLTWLRRPCYHNRMDRIIINQPDLFGTLWMIGWIFTIGYLKLTFWKGVLALIIWPYYMGVKFRKGDVPQIATHPHGENKN